MLGEAKERVEYWRAARCDIGFNPVTDHVLVVCGREIWTGGRWWIACVMLAQCDSAINWRDELCARCWVQSRVARSIIHVNTPAMLARVNTYTRLNVTHLAYHWPETISDNSWHSMSSLFEGRLNLYHFSPNIRHKIQVFHKTRCSFEHLQVAGHKNGAEDHQVHLVVYRTFFLHIGQGTSSPGHLSWKYPLRHLRQKAWRQGSDFGLSNTSRQMKHVVGSGASVTLVPDDMAVAIRQQLQYYLSAKTNISAVTHEYHMYTVFQKTSPFLLLR